MGQFVGRSMAETLRRGFVRGRGNGIEIHSFDAVPSDALTRAVQLASRNSDTLYVDTGIRSLAYDTAELKDAGWNLRDVRPFESYYREDAAGSMPMLADLGKAIDERFVEPLRDHVNYSGLGATQDVFTRNLSRLRRTSPTLDAAAIRMAAWRSRATAILSVARGAMREALKDSDIGLPEFWLALTEGRLQGIRGRWERFSQEAIETPDDQMKQVFSERMADLLDAIEGKKGIPSGLSQTAAGLVEREDWDNLRDFLATAFSDAASRVATIMEPAWFNYATNKPEFRKALDIYKESVEKPMAEAHSAHEGIFSDALGPLDTYVPLIPLNEEQKAWGPGRRLPYSKPKNRANAFATGLAKAYNPTVEAFRERLERAIFASSKFELLKLLEDEGWFEPMAPGQTTFVQPDGREVPGAKEEMAPGKVIVLPGEKGTRTIGKPAKMGMMPKWLHTELKPILAGRDRDPQTVISKVIGAFNTVAVMGVMEPVWHGTNVIGAVVLNSPFLLESLARKGFKRAKVEGLWGLISGIMDLKPSDADLAHDLVEMSKLGIIPDRYGHMTYSKAEAAETGAKRVRLSLAPLLFGSKGVDIIARWMMYKAIKELEPDADTRKVHDFVNQLGNYVAPLQGKIEQLLKRSGVSPFFTAGQTMMRVGLNATLGTGPVPGEGTAGAVRRAVKWMTVGVAGMVIFWALLHRWLTGKNVWEDKSADLGYLPIKNDTPLKHKLWGTKDPIGKINIWAWNPLVARGLRGLGIPRAFRTANLGGNAEQILEAALTDVLNSYSHPVMGPFPRAIIASVLGAEAQLTGMRDTSGRMKPQAFSALPAHTGGFAKTTLWRAGAAARELNSFYHGLAVAAGLFPENPEEQGDDVLRMVTNIVMPRFIGPPANPEKSAEFLQKQAAAIYKEPDEPTAAPPPSSLHRAHVTGGSGSGHHAHATGY